MRTFLAPPVFSDEDQTHTAQLLHVILLILILACILFVLPNFSFKTSPCRCFWSKRY